MNIIITNTVKIIITLTITVVFSLASCGKELADSDTDNSSANTPSGLTSEEQVAIEVEEKLTAEESIDENNAEAELEKLAAEIESGK